MENLPPTRLEKRFFCHKNCTIYVKQTDEGGEFSQILTTMHFSEKKNVEIQDNHRLKSQKETFHHQYIIKVSAEFSR